MNKTLGYQKKSFLFFYFKQVAFKFLKNLLNTEKNKLNPRRLLDMLTIFKQD